MAANTLPAVVDRVRSVLGGAPFRFIQAQAPYDFGNQPSGQIDQVFTVDGEHGSAIGGFSYTEERIDRVRIGVARVLAADPQSTYNQLHVDATSIVAAVTRDGAQAGGDYDVMDGRAMRIEHLGSEAFAVLRLDLSVNYEAQL